MKQYFVVFLAKELPYRIFLCNCIKALKNLLIFFQRQWCDKGNQCCHEPGFEWNLDWDVLNFELLILIFGPKTRSRVRNLKSSMTALLLECANSNIICSQTAWPQRSYWQNLKGGLVTYGFGPFESEHCFTASPLILQTVFCDSVSNFQLLKIKEENPALCVCGL